jgi:hypothetical protein
MLSSSLRNMTPQSIARLCASSQIEFGEGRWREEESVVFCPPADTVGEVRELTEIREKIEVMSLRDLNQEAH